MPHGHGHHHGGGGGGGGGGGWGGWGGGLPYPYYYPYPYWVDPLGVDPVVSLSLPVEEENPVGMVGLNDINSDVPVLAPWGYPYSLPEAMDPTVGIDPYLDEPANYLSGTTPSGGFPQNYPYTLTPEQQRYQMVKKNEEQSKRAWLANECAAYKQRHRGRPVPRVCKTGVLGLEEIDGCGGNCGCDHCKEEHGGMGAVDVQSKFTTPIIIAMAVMIGLCYLKKK